MAPVSECNRVRRHIGEPPEWPVLVSKAVEDISRIVRAEVRLVQLEVRDVAEREIDRALKATIALALIICGAICAIAATILLLQFLLGMWWLAFGIVAGLALGAGLTVWLITSRRPPRKEAR
jgi:hypothetical protein